MDLCSPAAKRSWAGDDKSANADPEAFLPAYVEYSRRSVVLFILTHGFLWHVVRSGSGTMKIYNTLLELCRGIGPMTPDGNRADNSLTEAGLEVMKVLPG